MATLTWRTEVPAIKDRPYLQNATDHPNEMLKGPNGQLTTEPDLEARRRYWEWWQKNNEWQAEFGAAVVVIRPAFLGETGRVRFSALETKSLGELKSDAAGVALGLVKWAPLEEVMAYLLEGGGSGLSLGADDVILIGGRKKLAAAALKSEEAHTALVAIVDEMATNGGMPR